MFEAGMHCSGINVVSPSELPDSSQPLEDMVIHYSAFKFVEAYKAMNGTPNLAHDWVAQFSTSGLPDLLPIGKRVQDSAYRNICNIANEKRIRNSGSLRKFEKIKPLHRAINPSPGVSDPFLVTGGFRCIRPLVVRKQRSPKGHLSAQRDRRPGELA
jgi:hypothetical protein